MRAGLWPDKYTRRVIVDSWQVTNQRNTSAAMAPLRSSVTRAVNTRILLPCVLNLRSTSSLSDVEWIQLLTSQGATSTLNFMNTYWISDDESNEAFWEVKLVHTSCLHV